MIKVYLEKTGTCDHIISYETESAYAKDLPTLEAYAKEQGGILTESVSEVSTQVPEVPQYHST